MARQAVRRLVSLGFNLDNLKNSFRADPNYEIPANVFLQDMTQVKLNKEYYLCMKHYKSGLICHTFALYITLFEELKLMLQKEGPGKEHQDSLIHKTQFLLIMFMLSLKGKSKPASY